ncbi:AAA family ATPase [Candidatus Gracilibacteria bacterium]|nr:AAA family ATPase [Candidatus Gracilibacteria bacterium]
MLNIDNLSPDAKSRYKKILKKRKDNPDALSFLKQLDTTDNCIFLTGKAGTGKSTLIKDIIEFCTDISKPPLALGSTGISALNIGGQTVHSFFALGIENVYFKDIQHYLNNKKNRQYKLKKKKVKTLMNVPFVIIDEISMLNSSTIDCINFLMSYNIAKQSKDPSLAKKSFGGKPVIFVGDVFQLPPVSNPAWKQKFADKYESERFFDSLTFKNKLDYDIIELKKNYRQEHDEFFGAILDAIRNEDISDFHLSIINKQLGDVDGDAILLSTHRNKVDTVNNKKLFELEGEEYLYHGETQGKFPEGMKKADDILRLKKGAKVMMITNDMSARRINGSMGFIKGLGEDFIDVEIGNDIVSVLPEVRYNKEVTITDKGIVQEDILGTYSQFPLKLAYSITIHKSQGMTFDTCTLDLYGTFTGGQAYTALSRSRTLAGIKLLTKIERRHLFFHPAIKKFIQEHMT